MDEAEWDFRQALSQLLLLLSRQLFMIFCIQRPSEIYLDCLRMHLLHDYPQ